MVILKNKLFIVCPFSCMESVLRRKFGNDIFFLTCSGAVLEGHEFAYMEAVKTFILSEKIGEIYIVNDTSCRFINAVLSNDILFGFPAESILMSIYEDHYHTDFKGKPLEDQQLRLAKMNIARQVKALRASSELSSSIDEGRLVIKGLVTSKGKSQFEEVILKSNNNKIYEF